MEQRYTLDDMALMSGLTTRTLRTYLADSLLRGEMLGGMWTFSPEDVAAFFAQPVIRQRMESKSSGMVMDFLIQPRKAAPSACTVLDLPMTDETEEEALREKLLAYVNTVENSGFRYDLRDGMVRITFTGPSEAAKGLLALL